MSDNKIQQRLKNRKEILPNIIYTICEAADALNLCETTIRILIAKNELKSKRIGRGRGNHRIWGKWIIEFLNKKEKQ